MSEMVIKNEKYQSAFGFKKKADLALRRFFASKTNFKLPTRGSILELSKLGITGGPKDLSKNLDSYLYS